MKTTPHPGTWIAPELLGTTYPSYQPTYSFGKEFINDTHQSYKICTKDGVGLDLGIKGWLRIDDALKIYELAYFSEGNILELGSYNGLSTSILSRAAIESPTTKSITSVDLMFSHVVKTWFNLFKRGLSSSVTMKQGDAAGACRSLAEKGNRFSFVFIDHSHTYEHVVGVCRELGKLVENGGFCLFHDFNDPRECDSNSSHGVSRAVFEGLDKNAFEFYGIYGCSALYRKKTDL